MISITNVKELPMSDKIGSVFKDIAKQIYLPTYDLDNSAIANIELCKLAFPKIEENYLSLGVPVNTPSEIIVLNFYLKQVSEYISFNTYIHSKDYLSMLSDSKSPNILHQCCPESPKMSPSSSVKANAVNEIQQYQLECEEKHLRKAITSHLIRLRSIYKQYTTVACLKHLPYKTLLIRMFLWQLYRDCQIPQKGISLSEIDKLLAENPDTELETQHSPFEVIYFWQFLHSLLSVALSLYAQECAEFVNQGILKTCFVKLLETDIFPNYGHHTDYFNHKSSPRCQNLVSQNSVILRYDVQQQYTRCVLFDYVDILPLKPTYKWFQEFKEPYTVLNFIRDACTIKKCEPPSYYRKAEKSQKTNIRMGINAYVIGHEITYLQDELPNIRTEPSPEEIKVSDREVYKRLFHLRSLGAKKVLSILAKVCPKIKEDNVILDMQYELTFYEFYEAVLLCTQELVNRENKRKAKENAVRISTGSMAERKSLERRKSSKKHSKLNLMFKKHSNPLLNKHD